MFKTNNSFRSKQKRPAVEAADLRYSTCIEQVLRLGHCKPYPPQNYMANHVSGQTWDVQSLLAHLHDHYQGDKLALVDALYHARDTCCAPTPAPAGPPSCARSTTPSTP